MHQKCVLMANTVTSQVWLLRKSIVTGAWSDSKWLEMQETNVLFCLKTSTSSLPRTMHNFSHTPSGPQTLMCSRITVKPVKMHIPGSYTQNPQWCEQSNLAQNCNSLPLTSTASVDWNPAHPWRPKPHTLGPPQGRATSQSQFRLLAKPRVCWI